VNSVRKKIEAPRRWLYSEFIGPIGFPPFVSLQPDHDNNLKKGAENAKHYTFMHSHPCLKTKSGIDYVA
jgi:hypothetical protein